MTALHLSRPITISAYFLCLLFGSLTLRAQPQASAAEVNGCPAPASQDSELPPSPAPADPQPFPADSLHRVVLTVESATSVSGRYEHEARLTPEVDYLLELSDLARGGADRQSGGSKSAGVLGTTGSIKVDVAAGTLEAAGSIGAAGTSAVQDDDVSKAKEAIKKVFSSLETVVFAGGSLAIRPADNNRGLVLRLVADGERQVWLQYQHASDSWSVRYDLTIDDGLHAAPDAGTLAGSVLLKNCTAYPWKDVRVTLAQNGVTASATVIQLEPGHSGVFRLNEVRKMPIVARRVADYTNTGDVPNETEPKLEIENKADGGRDLLGGTIRLSRDERPSGEVPANEPLFFRPNAKKKTMVLSREPRLTVVKGPTSPTAVTRVDWHDGSLLSYWHTRATAYSVTNDSPESWTVKLNPATTGRWEVKSETRNVLSNTSQTVSVRETAKENLDVLFASSQQLRAVLQETDAQTPDGKRLSAIYDNRKRMEEIDVEIAGFRAQGELLRQRREAYLTAGLRRSDLPTLFTYQDSMQDLVAEIGKRERERVESLDQIMAILGEAIK